MLQWLSVRTHNTGFVSSNPKRVTMKMPLVRKVTVNHLMKSTSLEKLRALSLVSATLEIEYATQFLAQLNRYGRRQALCKSDPLMS